MSKRNTFKKTAVLTLALMFTVSGAGCDFFPKDSDRDLEQIVATVNISDGLKKDDNAVADDVSRIITDGGLSTHIYKRDLIAYFYSYGYTYVNSYGYSYEQTYTLLMNTLVSQKVVTQYAIAYYLDSANESGLSVGGWENYLAHNVDTSLSADKQTAMKEVLTLKYFLTENDADNEAYLKAEYTLKKSLNSTLDSLEEQNITTEEEEHNHSEARTKPTNVGTEVEDYYPVSNGALNYDVYTGRNKLENCGKYEALDGSTTATRQRAYNSFLTSLREYGLVGKNENTKDITQVDYYYSELASSLSQSLINKYFEDNQDKLLNNLDEKYIQAKYKEIKDAQEKAAKEDPTAFGTSMDSVADDSFLLYGEANFGFVYNILIPFSAAQEQEYSAEKNRGLSTDELYVARKNILQKVQAKDLRDSWFDEHDHANYAYEIAKGDTYYDNGKLGDTKYLFFEDNMKNNDQYETLTQYAGKYPYNGTVDSELKATPNKMDIDGFIAEMEAYINYVVGSDVTSGHTLSAYNTDQYANENDVVDYSKFMYYEGKVELTNDEKDAKNFFAKYLNKDKTTQNNAYAALSAVNELMFAYSTDTGCLNTYMGYSVSPYKTSFVDEFEYAAQYAVAEAADAGVGKYVVCATDYGWHIIYVSFVYTADDVYDGYKEEEKDIEGTFSNMFYETLKSNFASNYQTEIQNNVLNKYNNDTNVTRYLDRYKDLWEEADA